MQENKILHDSKPAKFCQQNHMNILTSSHNKQFFYSIADFFVPFTTLSEQNVSLQKEKSNVSSRRIGDSDDVPANLSLPPLVVLLFLPLLVTKIDFVFCQNYNYYYFF